MVPWEIHGHFRVMKHTCLHPLNLDEIQGCILGSYGLKLSKSQYPEEETEPNQVILSLFAEAKLDLFAIRFFQLNK